VIGVRKKNIRRIGIVMLIIAVIFVAYALYHPEVSWPFPLLTVYTFYVIYLVVTLVLLIAPFGKKDG